MAALFQELSNILHQEVAMTVVCFTISLVSVGLRFWTKIMVLRKVQVDDWLLAAALVAFGVLFAFQCYLTYLIDRFVKHGKIPDWQTITTTLKTAVIMYPVSMALLKMALSVVLVRVFGANKRIKILVWAIAAFTVLSSLVTSIFVAATCGTMASLIPGLTKCSVLTAYNDIGTFFAAANSLTDLVLVVLSVAALWDVRMARWQKVSTLALLLLGMTTWVVSLARLIWTYGVPQSQWTAAHNTKSVFFSIVEIFAGITGTSLSGIRPLARIWQEKIRSSLKGSYPSRGVLSTTHGRPASDSTEAVITKTDGEPGHNSRRAQDHNVIELQEV
ncbi:hypothetical protein K461DRAFT_312360 [Myriangium duriaei CBS 260.36]|uniref:Rhodopsin domain-containing protein n=1 Tax=Myriangium duriaei CBS 260.36 TaxID=1168546 RepID=A0A9P4J6R0_9PEZI|nr:hypothetical protein K461DRAFT_312360 [Myriangium duriaei CBS 260.36]